MKKSLLALAVLGAFAGAASAQSSVTIYGVLDLAVAKGNGGAANLGAGNSSFIQTSKAYQMVSPRTSRLGFRGNEDLGGGLSAQFHIEHRFNADTGAQNNAGQFWNALSYVQLSSAQAGKVYLGRYYTPTFLIANRTDPFGTEGVAQLGTAYQYANFITPDTGTATALDVRTSNTVGYATPSFGGFVFTGAVSGSEATQRGKDVSASGVYAAGPIYAAVGFERVYKGAYRGQQLINAGVTYDLGVVKLLGYYGRSKTAASALPGVIAGVGTPGVGVNTSHAWTFGVSAPVGPGTVKAAYGRVDPRFANNTRQKVGLGYEYNLSKRTSVYGEVAYARETANAVVAGVNRGVDLTNSKAALFGLRHAF